MNYTQYKDIIKQALDKWEITQEKHDHLLEWMEILEEM